MLRRQVARQNFVPTNFRLILVGKLVSCDATLDSHRASYYRGGSLGYRVRVGGSPNRALVDAERSQISRAGFSAGTVFSGWDGRADDQGPWQEIYARTLAAAVHPPRGAIS